MVLAEFTMFPTDKGESVSKYVAQIIDVIDKNDISYQLTSMGTILEGSWERVFDVISQCFRVLQPQSNRISVTIKVDYRHGEEPRMKNKVEKVVKLLKERD